MTDTLWRLTWALPLVLLVGAVAMLVLKRFLIPVRSTAKDSQRLTVRESLSLSTDTHVHLIELDRKPYLVVESTRASALLQTVEAARGPQRAGPPWMRRSTRMDRDEA